MSRFSLVAFALGLSVGCRRPPEAPADFDSLTSYTFEEALSDDEVLVEGLLNLQTWFAEDRDPDQDRGYELLVGLTQESVDALNGSAAWLDEDTKDSRTIEELAGVAVATVGPHAVEDYTAAITAFDQDVVFPDTFTEWSREWRLCDGEDFANRDCLLAEGDERQLYTFALGQTTRRHAYNQFRWVELPDEQWAMVHRNWQLYPPDTSVGFLDVDDQYYLNVFIPSTDGSETYRLQASWAVFAGNPPLDIALNLSAGSMNDGAEELDEWLEEE